MADVESLALQITGDVKDAKKGIDDLRKTLGKLKEATAGGCGLGDVYKGLKKIKNISIGLPAVNSKTSKSFAQLATSALKSVVSFEAIRRSLRSWLQESIEYNENLNLFSVAMGEYADGAMDYANKVGEAMGIDPSEWIRNQGLFMTLGTGFGIVGERAAVMSQQLTQLGYDISSFYNIDVTEAMQKLKSGFAGELEPLRALGYDLSEAKLKATALSLGIDKAVSSMTQAEKAELRYYAIMTQVTQSHGDMARTLEDPANQLRIFKAQLEMTARSLGNIFIPALNAILPYAIAAVKVVRILADAIAALFGYKIPEVADYATVGNDVASGFEEANGEVTKMKKMLLGIDELNVMSDTTSASDAYGGSGFSFEIPTYDFIDESVNSRVDEIVEKMKEWLGISDGINSWSDLLHTRLGKILIVVGAIGGALAAWKVAKGVSTVFSALGSLFSKKVTTNTGGIGGISVKNTLKRLANVGIIVGGIIALVGVIGLLTKIPGFNEVIRSGLESVAVVFNGLLPALAPIALVSVGLYALGKIKINTVVTGLANAAIIIGGMEILITAIGAFLSLPYLSDFLSVGVQSLVETFNGLYEIIIPIGLLSTYMAGMGLASVGTIASGFAGFALVIGGTEVVITAIGALMSIPCFSDFMSTGVTSMVKTFNGLYEVALPIGTLSALLVGLGIATPAVILSGLAGFASVVGGFELLLVALGALKQIPGFSWLVSEGADMLASLANALGRFAGSIVGGFTEGVSHSFPKIGENLADFMINAEPFFEGLDHVNADSLAAVRDLAEFVRILTGASVLEGLTSWFTGGHSLVKFGEDLREFAPAFVEYSKMISGVDVDVVQSSSVAAKSVAEFANNIPNSGGVVSWFTGENDMDVFGEKLVTFGKNFAVYSDYMKNVDAEIVTKSSNAAQSVVEFARNIPNSGGIASWFAGENDVDVFGEKLATFGANFAVYSNHVKQVNANVVSKSSDAAASVVEFARNIPNSGGVASWFAGENDIDVFGEKLATFGAKFATYSDSVKKVDSNVVTKSSDAAKSVVAFAKNVPNSGGVVSWFAGENDIDVFGKKLAIFGERFVTYNDYVKKVNSNIVTKSSDAAQSVVEFAKNIPNSSGVVAWFAGDNDIDVFGRKMVTFGEKFLAYSNYMRGVDADVIDKSSYAAKSVVEFADNIPNSGGVASWFAGDNGIDTFGGKLLTFGERFKKYYEELKNVSYTHLLNLNNCISKIIDFAVRIKNDVDTSRMSKFTDALNNMGKAIKDLPSSKTISISVKQSGTASGVVIGNVPLFSAGGFPADGQMFIAREAGPEMVGSIGNRTAVANNDQIVDAVSQGVYSAVVQAMGQSGGNQVVEAKVNDKVLFEVVVNRNRQETIRTGYSPLLGGA